MSIIKSESTLVIKPFMTFFTPEKTGLILSDAQDESRQNLIVEMKNPVDSDVANG